jgi:5-methylcytosine-specific restriction endonuclease McrA
MYDFLSWRKHRTAGAEEASIVEDKLWKSEHDGTRGRLLRLQRVKAASGSCSEEEKAAIRQDQNDCCVECGTPLNGKGELDHWIPLFRGGSHWPWNRQYLCSPGYMFEI